MVTKIKDKQKTGLKRTTIFLSKEHHEALRKMAFEKRMSMAKIIREAVLEAIEDDEDIKAIQEAEKNGDQEYVSLEEVEREWQERHKNE